ncbi:MAG TPA: alpha/beta hydrolase [Solirubrobacterales bacterium]|nr:alpha/beta hydrolase [Solirubrobacterales bacterium]
MELSEKATGSTARGSDELLTVELPQGRLEYRDQGEGPAIVFCHGLLVASDIWDEVVPPLLDAGYRCVRPELPMGSHRIPMNEDADLSPPGLASVIGEFLAALDLEDATMVGNDSGGAVLQMLAARAAKSPVGAGQSAVSGAESGRGAEARATGGAERIGRVVLTNCDIGKVFPPFPYNFLPPLARVPGGLALLTASMRLRPVRWLAYSPIAGTRIPDARLRQWLEPGLTNPRIRADTGKLVAGVRKSQSIEAAERLRDFTRPVLFAWGASDVLFRPSLAAGLADTLPDARVELIPRAKTYVMLERPDRLAQLIAEFAAERPND